MTKAPTRKRLTGWLGLSLALVGAIVLELYVDVNFFLKTPLGEGRAKYSITNNYEEAAKQMPFSNHHQNEILARPLFSPSRRPETESFDRHTIVLIGTMLVKGAKVVLLEHPEYGSRIVKQGETLGGWVIAEIEDHYATIEKAGHFERIELRTDKVHSAAVEDQQVPTEPVRSKIELIQEKIKAKNLAMKR